jgi:hypothetical protein
LQSFDVLTAADLISKPVFGFSVSQASCAVFSSPACNTAHASFLSSQPNSFKFQSLLANKSSIESSKHDLPIPGLKMWREWLGLQMLDFHAAFNFLKWDGIWDGILIFFVSWSTN